MLKALVNGIRAVNYKYRKPKIEMTPLVKFSLIVLRFYLFALIGLMLFKFVIAVKG